MKKKFVIALDIDDTLMPFTPHMIDLDREIYHDDVTLDEVTEWGFSNFPEEVRTHFYDLMKGPMINRLQKPNPGALKMIDTLQKAGHSVMIASAVCAEKMGIRSQQIQNMFPMVNSVMLGDQKTLLDCDFLLDDCADNVLNSHAKYPVLLRRNWNTYVTDEEADRVGVKIVHNYQEFLDYVQEKAMTPEAELLSLVGPSGSGKTAIANLLEKTGRYEIVQSATTRARRPDDGPNDYRFIGTSEEFLQMVDRGEFIEWSMYKGNFYGTPKDAIDSVLQKGKKAILILDINGTETFKEVYGNRLKSIAVFRRMEDLTRAIDERDTSDEVKAQRKQNLKAELIADMNRCDALLSNTGTLEQAMQEVERLMAQ